MDGLTSGIYQATSGLNAAQYAMSVISQNIANADTPGYSRQVANLETVGGSSIGLYTGVGHLGGVKVTGTARETDPVLDARLRSVTADGAQADTTSAALQTIETVFPEPSTSGLGAQLSTVWSDWSNVANNPGGTSGTAVRQTLLSDVSAAAGTLNTMSSSLTQLASTTGQELSANVTQVNTTASQLAELNGQIVIATATGTNANSLLDQRDQLLSTLSSLTGATVSIGTTGAATVSIGGQSLVTGNTATAMSVNSANQLSVGGNAVSLSTGTMSAQVGLLTTTIPGYQSQLDSVASSLASTLNGVQAAGYDANGNAGQPMIGTSDGSSTVTAANIKVVLTDPSGIAAAATQTAGGNLDGSNALSAAKSGTLAGGADSQFASLVGAVGTDSSNAQQRQTTQDAVVTAVQQQQQSISGVNYDQEVSDLMSYQQAYQASAKVFSTLDGLLGTLLDAMGN